MKKGLYLFPNLLTTGNLFCGILSIIFAINDTLRLANYEDVLKPFILSSWLILIAIVIDSLDGLIARMTKTTSKFGVEFDSLADLVSFGVAPAILVYLSVLRYHGKIGWFFVAIYIMGGALRLARFNVSPSNKYFQGLPIPASAGILTSYVILSRWAGWYADKGVILNKVIGWYEEKITYSNFVIVPVLVSLLSVLMVSSIQFPSFKRFMTRERMPLIILIACAIIILIFIITPEITSFLLMMFYLFYGLISGIFRKEQKQTEVVKSKDAAVAQG